MRIGRYRITRRGYVVFGTTGILMMVLIVMGLSYVFHYNELPSAGINNETAPPSTNQSGEQAVNNTTTNQQGEQLTSEEEAKVIKEIVSTIYFKPDSYEFDATQYGLLDPIIETSIRFKDAKLVVEGHFNGIPGNKTTAFRTELAQNRADVVTAYLVSQGINPDRISTLNLGCTVPVNRDESWQEIQKNRRVIVRFEPLK